MALHSKQDDIEPARQALQSLREEFFYHFINAEGTIQEVEANILDELKYQSSLELDEPVAATVP